MTPQVILRALEPADVDRLYAWENDPKLWDVSTVTVAPFSRQQLSDYVAAYDGDIYRARQLRLMIALPGGATIGTIDFYDFDPAASRCGVGVYIHPLYRRRGHAVAALTEGIAMLRRHVSIHQVYATVGGDNTPSLLLFDKCGFTPTATLRDWIKKDARYTDAILFQKIM